MPIYFLALALALVLLNGFFVATEFAIVKVRPTRIDELVRKQRFGAAAVRRMVSNLDSYLSATQLGVTMASLGLGWLGTPALAHLLREPLGYLGITQPLWIQRIAAGAAFASLSFLHIAVGELVPKSIAILRSESVALSVAVPMRIFHAVFFPAIAALSWVSKMLITLLGLRQVTPARRTQGLSEDEIKMILTQARSAGLLSTERADLLRKALTLPTKSARHLMVPRNDVVFLDVNLSLADNLTRAQESNHSRFPLCDRELDDVIGIVDIRQVLFAKNGDGRVDLRSFCTSAAYFPEVMSGERLLAEFRGRHLAMAVIVDEYGGASGIVTPADVVSAVMGEIEEGDEEEVVPLPGGAFDVEGTAPLEEVEETLKVHLEAHDSTTVAGFLMERLGRMPRIGDRVIEAGLAFNVLDVAGPRVRKVRIVREGTREPRKTDPGNPSEGPRSRLGHHG